MSIRPEIFGAKRVSIKTEDLDFYPQSNAKIKTNGKRVLNEDDLLGLISGLDPVGNAPNDYAASISAGKLQLQPCDRDDPGVLVEGAQNLPDGDKTLVGTFTSTNLSGTNTGDVTLTTIGATPNANGLSLTGQQLRAQPANGSFGGVVTATAQPFAGEKTFNDGVVSLKRYRGPMTADSTTGVIEFETAGSPGKRAKLHHYSAYPGYSNNFFWGGGDGTPETQAGNFTTTGVDMIGIGDGALFRVTTGNGHICLLSGNNITTATDCILLRGGYDLRVGNNIHAIGLGALRTATGQSGFTLQNLLIWGDGACENTVGNDVTQNAVIIGPDSCKNAEWIQDSVFISAREKTEPRLTTHNLAYSSIINCDVSGTAHLEKAVGIQSNLDELDVLSDARQKIYIGYPFVDTGGGSATTPVVKLGGVYFSGYSDSPTSGITDVKMVVVDNTDRLTNLPLPGTFGAYYQLVSDFSFANKSVGNVVPFSGSVTSNPFFHTVGNTFVMDIGGIMDIQFVYQSVTAEANLIWFIRKNGVNLASQQRYIGKAVPGVENAPIFRLEDNFDAGDIIDFTIQGNSDPGAGVIAATGAHSIVVTWRRRMSNYTSFGY
jgi:hypothetical protein